MAFLIIGVIESAWAPASLETWKYLFMVKTILIYSSLHKTIYDQNCGTSKVL